jgi:UrcA family protein
MFRYSFGAALAVSLMSAGFASAQPSPSHQDVMVVRLSDLDINHSPGAEVALRRIKSAAGKFCTQDDVRDLERRFEEQQCMTRMTTKAVNALGATEVATLWSHQSSIHGADQGSITLASRAER